MKTKRKPDVANPFALQAQAAIEITAAADGEAKKLPSVAIQAYSGGLLRLGGWYSPVVLDLAGVRADAPTAILLDHDATQIVGQGTAKVTAKGITIAGSITGDTANPADPAHKVATHAANGFVWKASIDALPERVEFVEAGAKVKVNGQTFVGPLNVVRAARLAGVSLLSMAADETATAKVAARAAGVKETSMEFAQWVQATFGLDAATLNDEQKAKFQAQFEAAQTPPEPKKVEAKAETPDAATEIELKAAAAVERIGAIGKIEGITRHPEIQAKAIKERWTVEKTELEVLRADRATPPAVHVHASLPTGAKVLEAALVMNQHVGGDDAKLVRAYGEQTLTEADKFRRIGFRDFVRVAARMAGIDLPLEVDHQFIRAAFSNTALTNILGAVANKALATSFAATRQVAPRISKAASHMNFHAHTVCSLALNGDLEEVGPRGELKSLNLSEETYTRQVKTRGAYLGISRADLINDELSAFTDMATRMGRKAAVARERAVFLLLNGTGAGSSFFTTAHLNYFDGAATNLQLSSLTTAVQKFRDQTGPDGDPVSIEPRILLVPTALEEVAKALMDRSALVVSALGSTSAAKKEPAVNIWAGAFTPEVSEWLGKTISGTAGSTTAWYLLADPQDVPVLELSYLNGRQEPVAEYFGLDQNVETLGVSWRIYYDFGADLAEYRGGVKSKGAS